MIVVTVLYIAFILVVFGFIGYKFYEINEKKFRKAMKL